MFTYQVRPRIFRFTSEGEEPAFPAECQISFHFRPPQPFGSVAGGGRTTVLDAAATTLFNANSGQHSIESKKPLSPLEVTIEEPTRSLHLVGTTLSISEQFLSLREVEDAILSIFFTLPTLLNVPFADPPFVERVDGKIGSRCFRWELAEWRLQVQVTSQDSQEERFELAYNRMRVISEPRRRRLVAGLHYFHVACRLARVGSTAGEFVAEVVLNLAKTLEVLFPPAGDGRTRDAARAGLAGLGYSEQQIERDFTPVMALRNDIDVGHVELGLFTLDQLKTIHAFTELAEGSFREMLERFLNRVESGQVDVAPHELGPPKEAAIKLIERLKQSAAEAAG